jgi:hypothetical protein
MAMTENLSLFFNQAEFAVAAVFTPAGGAAQPSASVIYDANGGLLQAMGVETLGPAVLVPATQWPTLREGDSLVLTLPAGAAAFKVRVVEALDDGALLLLTLARN